MKLKAVTLNPLFLSHATNCTILLSFFSSSNNIFIDSLLILKYISSISNIEVIISLLFLLKLKAVFNNL